MGYTIVLVTIAIAAPRIPFPHLQIHVRANAQCS